jgi:Fe-Mn family superoxide dismutase
MFSRLTTTIAKTAARRTLATSTPATLPPLGHAYNAFVPIISEEIMTIHHTKHHATYIANLNAALEKVEAAAAKGDANALIANAGAIKFNGGGHINHTLFWENLCPVKDFAVPTGALADMINSKFGSLEGLQKEMGAKTVAVQGSGWGWLGYNKQTKTLEIATCPNQDPLEATTGLIPLVGIDVWEHAYYIDYKNVRPNYVEAIWKVIDWKCAEKRLAAAM